MYVLKVSDTLFVLSGHRWELWQGKSLKGPVALQEGCDLISRRVINLKLVLSSGMGARHAERQVEYILAICSLIKVLSSDTILVLRYSITINGV